MKRVSLIYLGTTGAGPAIAMEWAKALQMSGRVSLQVIISSGTSNLPKWKKAFENQQSVDFKIVDTYKHSKLSVLTSLINFNKMDHLVDLIRDFNPDYLYSTHSLMWAFYIYPRVQRFTKIIITLHDPHSHDEHPSLLRRAYLAIQDRTYKRYTDDIIILNKRDHNFVSQKYKKPITIIPLAAHDYYAKGLTIDEILLKKVTHKLGFFGAIAPYKGLDILVDALPFIKTKNISLVVAGNGYIPEELKDKITCDSRITLINRYIMDEEVSGILHDVDIMVVPYRTATQSGIIPLAYAFGKALVSTNVGALEEQVPEGLGILVKPEPKEIAKAIDELYDHPDALLEMGRKSKHYSDTELTWDRSAELFINYIEKQ